LIRGRNGNIFGGFTPERWECSSRCIVKADPSRESFLFSLKNPLNFRWRKFADMAIPCHYDYGRGFGDLGVLDAAHADETTMPRHWTGGFGSFYINDTDMLKGQ
jgi:hypothetical protein